MSAKEWGGRAEGGTGRVTCSREAEESGTEVWLEGALDQPKVLLLQPQTWWVISRCSSVDKFINHESKRHLIHLNRKDVIRTVRLQRRSKV